MALTTEDTTMDLITALVAMVTDPTTDTDLMDMDLMVTVPSTAAAEWALVPTLSAA